MAGLETPMICYNCGKLIEEFDFYWIVTDEDGEQGLGDDLSPDGFDDAYEHIEVDVCPHCGACY